MNVYLFDGTFELCRAYFGAPSRKTSHGEETGAARSLLKNLYRFVKETPDPYIGCAFDHVIESFRNNLFDGYKTGEGMDEDLVEQFPMAEEASLALGLVTWPMKDFEADDGIATAAHQFKKSRRVDKVYLCSPDKDLAQCVDKDRVLLWDRLREKTYNEKAVIEKFGIPPSAIADFLALTGDPADGIPGIPKWGKKSAATLLMHYGHIEKIPDDYTLWKVKVRGAEGLADNLSSMREDATLYKELATLRIDAPIKETLDELKWRGLNKKKLKAFCAKIEDEKFFNSIPESLFDQ